MGSWWDQFRQQPARTPEEPGAPPVRQKAVSWQQNYPSQVNIQPVPVQSNDPHAVVINQGYLAKAPPSARENTTCPECGSTNFFSRTLGVMRGPVPAPLCAECGYNGLFTQTGTMLNAAGVISGGPTVMARSDNPSGESRVDWTHPIHMPGRRS
jgi:predicted nucleic-acid-binding Zn-ribbon protein